MSDWSPDARDTDARDTDVRDTDARGGHAQDADAGIGVSDGPGGTVDLARLGVLLGGDDLAWLRERVRRRVEQGAPLTGAVRLAAPSRAEREAADRLMGRRPSAGASVSVSLDALGRMLRDAGVSDGLQTAVVALDGPIVDRNARRHADEVAWAQVFADAADAVEDGWDDAAWPRAWLDDLATTGLLRRLAADAAHAGELLAHALRVLTALPVEGATTAGLAARVLGDSHALDDGRPLATLVLKALAVRGGASEPVVPPSGAQRRALWASVGVAGDTLSSSVLLLGLRRAGEAGAATLTDVTLRAHAEAGEPIRVTLSQLTRHPPQLGGHAGTVVYVCENPAVVAAAARRLGADAGPLVCVEGQPSVAAQTLLRAMADAGALLAYHGDFDWPGVRIAHLVIDRFGARPWRLRTADYLAAPAGPPLRGHPVPTSWDPTLTAAMTDRGAGVHEEQVLDDLLTDLA